MAQSEWVHPPSGFHRFSHFRFSHRNLFEITSLNCKFWKFRPGIPYQTVGNFSASLFKNRFKTSSDIIEHESSRKKKYFHGMKIIADESLDGLSDGLTDERTEVVW